MSLPPDATVVEAGEHADSEFFRDPELTNEAFYGAVMTASRHIADAALHARHELLMIGARPNHGLCLELDKIARVWTDIFTGARRERDDILHPVQGPAKP